MFNLQGKTVLITGGSSGIGAASAVECARAGARVIVSARRREALDNVLASLEGEGHTAIAADMSADADIARLVKEMPAVDGFVNSAGMSVNRLIRFADWAEMQRMLDVNLISVIKLTQALVKERKINKGGSMVYLASTAASAATPGMSVYSASKAAIVAFARGIAMELAPRQVRVNSVSPGLVDTPMTAGVIHGDSELLKADQAKYPLGHGKPQDIAGAVCYFLSDASRWVTGTDFIIDGGFLHYR